jgi:DNA-binding CsgD family transcriptional regulator
MHQLGSRDARALLDCLRTTYATLDLEAFPRQVIAGLRRVVAAPFGSYNEIDHRAARIRYVVEPSEAQVPHLELVVREYLHEQPVLAHYRRTGDGSPHKLSDFLTRQQFHRLGIYNENYRRTGVEYQMSFMVESLQRPSPCTIAIALDRSGGDSDFTERDRFILSLLRPHVMTAYANAETVSALRGRAPATDGAPETRSREIIVLRRHGRHLISPRAADWLAEYFDDSAARRGRLSDDLQRWIRGQSLRLGGSNTLPLPARPLVVEREDTRLLVRLIPDSPDDLLLLEEQRTTVDYAALQQLGLTPRQAEVLHWVTEGKTNPEIGTILRTRSRTVGKHVEKIFAKLGVTTRTAAAVRGRA